MIEMKKKRKDVTLICTIIAIFSAALFCISFVGLPQYRAPKPEEIKLLASSVPSMIITKSWLSPKQLDRVAKVQAATGVEFTPSVSILSEFVANAKSLQSASGNSTSMVDYIHQRCRLNKFERKAGVNVIYTSTTVAEPKGVLLAFHGCSHTSKDFCFQSEQCPKCVGLPEEIRIAEIALRMNLNVIAITSHDKSSHCWEHGNVPDSDSDEVKNHDVHNVIHVLKREKVFDSALPIIAFGASSGGSFAALLSQSLLGERLIGVISQISADPATKSEYWGPHTPIVFSLMERDSTSVRRAKAQLGDLGQEGELYFHKLGVGMVSLKPRSLTPKFLSDRIPRHPFHGVFNEALALLVIDTLKHDGISSDNGHLNDPRVSDSWQPEVKAALKGTNWEWDPVTYDHSPIVEELNVAFALHELFSDYFERSLRFLIDSFLDDRAKHL